MNKLFNFTQAKGKWHKFLSFNLGRGAKLYKNFAKKLLAVSLCMAVVLLGAPVTTWAEEVSEPTTATLELACADGSWQNSNGTWTSQWSDRVNCTRTLCGLFAVPENMTGSLSFNWGTNTESDYDCLQYTLLWAGGTSKPAGLVSDDRISGLEAATAKTISDLTPGWYALTFTYENDHYQDGDEANECTVSDVTLALTTDAGKVAVPLTSIPTTMFATVDTLKSFNTDTGKTASNARIGLGTKKWTGTDFTGTGPATWWVCGVEDGGLVLYAAEALGGSIFGTTKRADNETYSSDWHTSDLFRICKTMGGEDSFHTNWANTFSSNELKHIDSSKILTRLYNVDNLEPTTSRLYLLAGRVGDNYAIAGQNLTVDRAWFTGSRWLRSAFLSLDGKVCNSFPGSTIFGEFVYDDESGKLSDYPSVAPAFLLDLSAVLFTSAASAASSAEGGKFETLSADTPMTLRLAAPEGSPAEVGAVGGTIGTLSANGWTLMVQGVTADGQNWSYSKAIESDDVVTVTADEVAAAGSINLDSFDNCEVWLEKPVESGGTLAYAVRAAETIPDPTPEPTPDPTPDAGPVADFLEATVDVAGQTQRLRVYDPNKVLKTGTRLTAEAVTEHENLDGDHEVEHLLAYNVSLLDAAGSPLPMPLAAPVELCFEVLDGLDKDELQVVLVNEFDDAEFEEALVERDGASWVTVKTDHFSPYALIDTLSDAEKAALDNGDISDGPSSTPDSGDGNNVKTGDLATQVAVAGLGMTLVLALGVMLRLITGKKTFEE